MNNTTAVLFDMDGVIFDSERAQMAIWLDIARQEGLPDMEAVYHRCIGVTVEATGKILREAYGADWAWQAVRLGTSEGYRGRCAGGLLPVKPGARELLDAQREKGVPLARASSTQEEMVRQWLSEAGLLGRFDLLVTGDMVTRSKPDPEIFLKACAAFPVKPEDAYVIEDSYNGIRAAHAGGMHALMVPDMLPPDAEMRKKAEQIFPSLWEVGAYLEIVLHREF